MPGIRFRLNGAETHVDADPDLSLLSVLRGPLGMTGPHFGCGANECGACNVMSTITRWPPATRRCGRLRARTSPRSRASGTELEPHPLQRAFIAEQACNAAIALPAS